MIRINCYVHAVDITEIAVTRFSLLHIVFNQEAAAKDDPSQPPPQACTASKLSTENLRQLSIT